MALVVCSPVSLELRFAASIGSKFDSSRLGFKLTMTGWLLGFSGVVMSE